MPAFLFYRIISLPKLRINSSENCQCYDDHDNMCWAYFKHLFIQFKSFFVHFWSCHTKSVKKNDQPIFMRKGILHTCLPSSIVGNAEYNIVSLPKTETAKLLKKIANTNPVINPATAAVPVVRFQNIPNKNMANTPGLIKPVYF